MAWVAIDRAIKTAEEYGLEGPVDRWKEVRQEIHDQVCDEGFNASMGSFTQYYGSDQLDASLLMIPLVGFLPAHDPRVRGTIEAVERELVDGGFVLRYRTADTGDVDGLTGREGAFLACSFWLADCLSLLGRDHDARQLLDRLMGLRNDLGLLAEEYDPVAGRLVGNFPQAFSHVSLVNSAAKLMGQEKPTSDHVDPRIGTAIVDPGKAGTVERHLTGMSAQSMMTKLVQNAGSGASTGAASVFQAAVAPAAGPAKRTARAVPRANQAATRARPTTKPSDRKSRPLATKAPVRLSDGATPAKKATTTKATTKKSAKKAAKATAKKAPGTKAIAKKVSADKSPAKKVAARKSPATKSAIRRPRVTKATTIKAASKRSSTGTPPAKTAKATKARAAAKGR